MHLSTSACILQNCSMDISHKLGMYKVLMATAARAGHISSMRGSSSKGLLLQTGRLEAFGKKCCYISFHLIVKFLTRF